MKFLIQIDDLNWLIDLKKGPEPNKGKITSILITVNRAGINLHF